jgi:putative integral membrane protein (TIGR02587 family)
MGRTGKAGVRGRSYSWSLREYARGIVGGLLFSLPLLYTMEVWWAGFVARPGRLLIYLAAGFLLLFGYNRYTGLHEDASWLDVGFEAVEEMGIGLLLAAGLLWLLGQIDGSTPPGELVGKVVVEGVTVAIGVSIGSSQLGAGGLGKSGGPVEGGMEGDGERPLGLTGQIVLASCGAVLFASNVAPTEEIVQIALETSRVRLLLLALLSLALIALILSYSDFAGSGKTAEGGLGTVTAQSSLHYAVALAASAFILWFFGRFAGASLATCVAQTVVLGVAGALGAATGRLLLQ